MASGVWSEWAQTLLAPPLAFLQQDLVPGVLDVWLKMQVPSYPLYQEAVQTCVSDAIQSTQSTTNLLYLTLRPVILLLGMALQLLGTILHILFQHLLEHGWHSLQKGAMQGKAAIVWFYIFQKSLSRKEVLGEVGLVIVGILGYYLRKWLKRQTYVARANKWYQQRKRKVTQAYTKTVHRVAQFSLFLAMAVPHATFLAVCVVSKMLFPAILSWLAKETYATALLSVWYPLLWTIGLIHNQRHPSSKGDVGVTAAATAATPTKQSVRQLASRYFSPSPVKTATSTASSVASSTTKTKQQSGYMKSTAAQKSRDRTTATTNKKGTNTGFFPKTTPTQKDSSVTSSEASTAPAIPVDPQDLAEYWLRYWVIYATVQVACRLPGFIPILGRFLTRHPTCMSWAAEFQLVFFIWIFSMERLISSQDAVLAQALPAKLLHQHVTPFLLEFQTIISEAVPKATWQNIVVDKSRRVLDLLVMVRLLSEPWKEWWLHVLEESRVLVLPSFSLLMPGFITQLGVTYVQFVLPTAKSLQTTNDTSTTLLYLQYWVLHCAVSGLLTWFASITWWIPFSTHMIYLLWCHLSFGKTIGAWYDLLEMELVAFGLLEGDAQVEVHQTLSVRLLTSIVQRLPSAAEEKDLLLQDDEEPSSLQPELLLTAETKVKDMDTTPGDENEPSLVSPKATDETDVMDADTTPSSVIDDSKTTTKKKKKVLDDNDNDEEYVPPPSQEATVDENANATRRSTRNRRKPDASTTLQETNK